MIFHSWTEKFTVLTNVGLLYYDDPNEKLEELFPTINAIVKAVPYNKYNCYFVFCIESFNIKIEFAAPNSYEYESWLRAFKKLQQEFDRNRASQLSSVN